MKLVYFAWVRERVGKAEEELAPPASVKTVVRSDSETSRRSVVSQYEQSDLAVAAVAP